jgi:DNA polymerase-3 subunit delta
MAEKRYPTFLKETEKGVFSPLYLFYGEETFLIDEALERIYHSLIDPDSKDFNYRVVYADEEEPVSVIDEAKTVPFMGEKKLIIIKNINKLKKNHDILIDYCLHPCSSTCLVFTATEIDKRKKLFQTLLKNGNVVRFDPLPREGIGLWIKKRLKEEQMEISDEAVAYLIDFIGSDLQTISNEMEKLVSFAGKRSRVDVEDMETVTGDIQIRSVFELSSAIGWKKKEEALRLINKIFLQGEVPYKILGLIGYQFRSILLAKFFSEKGYHLSKISKEMGIPVSFLREYIEEGKSYRFDELKGFFGKLLDIDYKIKSSRLYPKTVLESLILKM